MKRSLLLGALLVVAAIAISQATRNTASSIAANTHAATDAAPDPAGETGGQAGMPASPPPLPQAAGWRERADFESLLSGIKRRLPEQGDLRKLSEGEIHALPVPISLAAVALGEVAQAVARDPSLAPRALEFYRECAEGTHPNTIRAFCAARARAASPEGQEPAWVASLPEPVQELSRLAVLSKEPRPR